MEEDVITGDACTSSPLFPLQVSSIPAIGRMLSVSADRTITMTHHQDEEEFQSRFPFRLHTLLSNIEKAGLTHIMSWLPCGTRFKIHDTERFTTEIMPKIGRCTRYKSFLRQLSMYKFHRTMSGPLKGTYHHPYFRRNRIDECRGVLRGRAPVMNYQQDDRINSRSEIATADELENETAITMKAKGDEVVKPNKPVNVSRSSSSWVRQATVIEEIELFSSSLPPFSSNARRKPNEDFPDDLPIASFLDVGLRIATMPPPQVPGAAVQSVHLDWRGSSATDDIVKEIIYTFTTS